MYRICLAFSTSQDIDYCPSKDWTLDDMIAKARKLKNVAEWPFEFRRDPHRLYQIYAAFGGEPFYKLRCSWESVYGFCLLIRLVYLYEWKHASGIRRTQGMPLEGKTDSLALCSMHFPRLPSDPPLPWCPCLRGCLHAS
jgi:hypothetical protein